MKDKEPDVRGAFEAAGKGLEQPGLDGRVNTRVALDAAVKALSEVDSRGELGKDGKKALELCQRALESVPEKIREHAPSPELRAGGSLAPMADRVDRKVKEDQEA